MKQYSDSKLIIEYEDDGTVVENEELYVVVDEIIETFLGHLTDRLNARLKGKWLAREEH